jgi:YVTN family beta-propeller protein
VIGTITVGSYPKFMDITPDNKWLYVSNKNSGSVSIIDVASKTLKKTVSVGLSPTRVVAHPNGSRVYVSNFGSTAVANSSLVSVFDTKNHTVIKTVGVGDGPTSLDITPDGTRLISANQVGGSVSVIDTTTNTLVGTTAVGGSPWTINVSPTGNNRAYTNPAKANAAAFIDGNTAALVASIPVGTGPYWGAVNAAGTLYAVTNPPDGTVSIMDTATNKVVATVATDLTPWVLEFAEVPVTDNGGGTGGAPVITGISPSSAKRGTSVTVSLFGTGFVTGAQVAVTTRPAGVTVSNVQVASSTKLTMTLTVAADAVTAFLRGFKITNPDGQTVTKNNMMTIVP